MRVSTLVLPAVALSIAVRAAELSAEPEPGLWSYTVDFGTGILQDSQTSLPNPYYRYGDELTFGPGVRLYAGVDYRVLPWLEAGIATGYEWNPVNSLLGFTPSGGGFSQIPILVQATLHHHLGQRLEVFGGGSVGTSFSRTDLTGPENDGWLTADSSDFVFAAGAHFGLSYRLGQGYELGLAYRYLWTKGFQWDIAFWDPFVETAHVEVSSGDLHSHSLLLAFRARF